MGNSNAALGPLPITVTLYRSLEPVIARRVLAHISAEVTVATIVISRTCEGVECPNDDPALESCLGGRCVDPRCTVETPEFCPPDLCRTDDACEVVACADPLCSDGVCFALPVDDRCGDGERCDGILGCVPVDTVRDAGFDAPSLDAGPDAPVLDAGVDSFVDAGNDAIVPDAFDAGPATGPFGPPQLLSTLTMDGARADDPTLTADLLQIFIKSPRPFSRVWTSRRNAIGEPFPPPTELDALLPSDTVTSPELRPDGLVLYFTGRPDTDFNVYRVERPSLSASFSMGTLVAEVNTPASEFAFVVDASETLAFFSRGAMFETRRASTEMPWGAASPVTELNRTGSEIDAHVSGDGLVLYFAGNDPDGGGRGVEIWRAERPTIDAPFGTPMRVDSVSSTSQDTDPWLSEDERVIVFMSRRDGREQIYVATRDGGVF